MQLGLLFLELFLLCVFQYPRSDRRRCNETEITLGLRKNTLSVSSVGSEAMQPRIVRRSPMRKLTFSILGRIGGDATPAWGGSRRSAPGLSVSSVGSEAMQPGISFTAMTTSYNFQYPRSDRRRCNGFVTTPLDPVQVLSVSSVGSEAMQHCITLSLTRHLPTFSILGRIGGDATRGDRRRLGRAGLLFQYPRSDRRRCNPEVRCYV